MEWQVLFTDEFGEWWDSLDAAEQEDVDASVGLLEQMGPTLRFPHSSGVATSKYSEMRELRIQHAGRPYRVLYAFDPTRSAILLIGGDKTGQDRWYEICVPIADKLYAEHLASLQTKETSHAEPEAPELQRTARKNVPRVPRAGRRKDQGTHEGHGPR